MPKPLDFFASQGQAAITDLQFIDVGMTAAEDAQFTALGLKPDAFKAYMGFKICGTLPNILGPVQSGNFIGFTPETMNASHASLLHQQLNIRHLLRADHDPESNPITRDRIIGAVVATSFPKPSMGWKPGESYPITAHAVVFKLAEGVDRLLGAHLSGKETQSVSIEANTSFGNMGVHRPSTGETHPILQLPTAWQGSLRESKTSLMPQVGKLAGEQLIVTYGLNGQPVALRGVGVTPNPAERNARIIGVTANQNRSIERTEETCFAIAAQAEVFAMVGQSVPFKTGRVGVVYDIVQEGTARIEGTATRLAASAEDPVLKIRLPDGATVLRSFSQVMDAGS